MNSKACQSGIAFRAVVCAGCYAFGLLLCYQSAVASVTDKTADDVCLMLPSSAAIEAQISAAVGALEATQNEHYRIVLQYSVLRRSDGTGGFTDLALIDEHLRDINWGFRDTPFVFVRIPGVRYIDNDAYFALDTVSEAEGMYTSFHTPGVANIYMHPGTLFNNPNARSYTSPPPPRRGHTYGDTRIGLPANIAYSPHELGHFFFLLHPYESGFAGTECVARERCDETGDLVCDTPASPAIFQQNTLRTGEYIGNAVGPCSGDGPYAPLTDLWMEAGWQYGDPGALIRNRFTDGQIERMRGTLLSLSPDLIGEDRPEVLVDCDFDGLDDIDEILEGSEPDINQDKVPDACQKFLRSGDLLVSGMTNIDTNTPRFFDPQTGAFRGALRTGAWYMHQLRTGPDGLIYATSVSVIQQLDPVTGRLVKNLVDGGPQSAGTFTDILFDAAGNLLVLDLSNKDIKRYSRETGEFLGTFAQVPLSSPKYMEYGPDGHIYVVGNAVGDNRVVRLNAQTGADMGDLVTSGSGGLTAGQGLVFHEGYLYVSDGANASVLRFDAMSGEFDREFVSPAGNGGLANPHSLRFGPDGRLYVASRGSNSVKRYDGTSGVYIDDFIPAGSGGPQGTGTIDQPAGLLFASVPFATPGPDINPGMNGAWTNLETLGQGMFFDVVASQKQLFMGWFSYETDMGIELDPDENAHRWLVAIGPYSGDTATLELLAVDGGTFNGPEPVTETAVGQATLKFRTCTEAVFEYALDAGLAGALVLNRLLPDTLCNELSGGVTQHHE